MIPFVRIVTVTIFGILLLTTCGTTEREDETDALPWANANFLEPATTILSFTNQGADTTAFYVDLRKFISTTEIAPPKTLNPGDSFSVAVQTHRPRLIYVRFGPEEYHKSVLPGINRHLVITDSSIVETGDDATTYNYLDETVSTLNPVGRMPHALDNPETYYKKALEKAQQHVDTIALTPDLPAYVPPLVERSLPFFALYTTLSLRGYHRFFYQDTITLPPTLIHTADSLFREAGRYQSFAYAKTHDYFTMTIGETEVDPKNSASTNDMDAITTAFTRGYSSPPDWYDALSTYLLPHLRSDSEFTNKAENIQRLLQTLPEDYQTQILSLTDVSFLTAKSETGVQDLMATPLLTPNGAKQSVKELNKRSLQLVKLWFAGCYPCLVQQPYEKELLAQHPEVDLIYLAHSTSEKKWLLYLEQHQPPANFQLRIPDQQLELITNAVGGLGAPVYLLLDALGKPICEHCPKPNDPLLAEIIAQNL